MNVGLSCQCLVYGRVRCIPRSIRDQLLILDRLVGLSTGLERAVHDGFKWRHLHIFMVVYFVENVKCYDSLTPGQHLRLDQVAQSTARLEPVWFGEIPCELLDTLVKSQI